VTTRPAVVEVLLAMDPISAFTHADGSGYTVDEANLALDATSEERIEAAEARLTARVQAAQRIRRRLLEDLADAGVTAKHAARLTGGVSVRLERVPHSELLKILTPTSGVSTAAGATTWQPGRDWSYLVAREAGLREAEVREVLSRRVEETP
jgi:hypothetical protein